MLAIGQFAPAVLEVARRVAIAVLDPVGQIFLRMLFFVVIPLIFATLALGVLQLGRLHELGPLATRTFALFALNMSIAVALGLSMMNVLEPGGRLAPATQARLMEQYGGLAQTHLERQAEAPHMSFATLVDMFMPQSLRRVRRRRYDAHDGQRGLGHGHVCRRGCAPFAAIKRSGSCW